MKRYEECTCFYTSCLFSCGSFIYSVIYFVIYSRVFICECRQLDRGCCFFVSGGKKLKWQRLSSLLLHRWAVLMSQNVSNLNIKARNTSHKRIYASMSSGAGLEKDTILGL